MHSPTEKKGIAGAPKERRIAGALALLVCATMVPVRGYAASYSLYQSVSQAWASRGFVARPSSPTYRPPGPASDPWGPYIQDAARRFSIPETWIRAVMHQESGGKQYLNGDLTTSGAGAMGLMQLMPATYADMQSQYGLGSDPYDPRDNIRAGAAYIRLMYDRYGAPGFLAAYNAGPDRVDAYLNSGRPLPDETVNYIAAITPNLGGGVAVRGQWAPVPASETGATSTEPDAFYARADLTRTADGCLRDPNAAYDPTGPCLMDRDTPHPDPVPDTAAPVLVAEETAPDQAAFPAQADRAQIVTASLTAPANPAGTEGRAAALAEQRREATARLQPAVAFVPYGAAPKTGSGSVGHPAHVLALPSVRQKADFSSTGISGTGTASMVQVGAFSSYAEARRVADQGTRVLASRALKATPKVASVQVSGRSFYRAQLVAENTQGPTGVCQILQAESVPCIPVRKS
ncbi:transglycosylase SLT domain-containing protein [Acetobacter senegalensis]|nr:transglycosylase SLT domain-containing protein [Acetobacter senegalensis]MDN7351634.1 transglycosylase SLT domain-containing protein [Acetobacter senegalensis]